MMMELRLRLLTLPAFPESGRVVWAQQILDSLKTIDLDKVIKQITEDYQNEWNQLVKEICEMESIKNKETIESWQESQYKKEELKVAFFGYLIRNEGKYDPDVKFMYATMTGDNDLLQEGLDEGADLKMTDLVIIKKYQSVYDEFIKNYKPRE